MSGPKVVRIVTREEIEAICRRHIALVAAAVHEAIRRAERCSKLDDALRQSLLGRIASLETLLTQNQWTTIQKQAPQTVVFLRSEGNRLEKEASDEAARARGRRRRSMAAARSIADALRAAGIAVGAELERAANGKSASLDDAESAISAGVAALPAPRQRMQDKTERSELAARLRDREAGQSVDEWMARQPGATAHDQRLDALIAELHVLGDAAAPLVARADAILDEEDTVRRRLLTDSLILDAGAQVSGLRQRAAIDSGLQDVLASLDGVETDVAGTLRVRVQTAVGLADDRAAQSLAAEAASVVEAHGKVLAATARRRAVLGGLSSLGYEIRESMFSSWEADGRVIVRKPGTTDYGVELAAAADAARFQMRLVGSIAPKTPRDALRDADQEIIWCGELARLRADLTARGGELILERVIEAGSIPVRSVEMPQGFSSNNEAAATRDFRKQRGA